jgi:hypothetical protein
MKTLAAGFAAAAAAVGLAAAAAAAPADGAAWPPYTPVQLDGRTAQTLKHRFTVDETALPAQIVIKPDPRDLPLELRAENAEVGDADLEAVGRGKQLRAPLRLVAQAAGKTLVAKATQAAEVPRQGDAGVTFAARLKAGPLPVDVTCTYACDGAMVIELSSPGHNAPLDALELVMDMAGTVDLACAGLGADFRPDGVDRRRLDVALSGEEGVVWDSAADQLAAKDAFCKYLYFGSGDRGFTWLCDTADGWQIDPKQPVVTLERDDQGRVAFRAKIVNRPVKRVNRFAVRFALLTHPSRAKPKGFRRTQWLDWPSAKALAAGTPKGYKPATIDGAGQTTLAAREQLIQLARALAAAEKPNRILLHARTASALASCGRFLELSGPAGGNILSRSQDSAALYPASLFRYLAGTGKALAARVRSNLDRVLPPGDLTGPGRGLLGRALAHDIGVDLGGLDQPEFFRRVVTIMHEFGLFADDGLTEVIPYWRSRGIVRYGEAFDTDDPFELTVQDPYARVHVTAFRRPIPDSRGRRRGYKVMFVVLNETDKAVRERLFLLDPKRLLGRRGQNRITGREVVAGYDYGPMKALVPGYCDWGQKILMQQAGYRALKDLENDGLVEVNSAKGRRGEIYGPLFVLPHDFRILYADNARR